MPYQVARILQSFVDTNNPYKNEYDLDRYKQIGSAAVFVGDPSMEEGCPVANQSFKRRDLRAIFGSLSGNTIQYKR